MDSSAPATSSVVALPVRTFARGFALRAPQTAWLLGAGASADAGVPTAGQLIDQLLAVLYCSDTGLPRDRLEADPRWRNRVRAFYDEAQGLPPVRDNAFYSAIFERVYPDRDARARFIDAQLRGHTPHLGQHQLAALVAAGLAPVLLTTNFDTLLEDAVRPMLAPGERLTVLEPESASRAPFTLATGARPLLLKIHGDLGAVTVKNTTTELMTHDERLRDASLNLLGRYGLIVVGYSGRDPAVMAMLRKVLQLPNPFPAGLTWVRRPEDPLADEVASFLTAARAAGVDPVHEVEASGMLEVIGEVERAVTLPLAVRERLARHRPVLLRHAAPAPAGPVAEFPQLRLGAVPVLSLPNEARRLEATASVPLTVLRKSLRQNRVRAVLAPHRGGGYLAFGDDEGMRTALAEHGVRVSAETVPLGVAGPDQPDSIVVGLLVEALARGLGRTRGITEVLRSGQRHQLRARDPRPDRPEDVAALAPLRRVVGEVTGMVSGPGGAKLPWAEAVTLSLDWHDGSWWLLFAPDVWLRPAFTERPPGLTDEQAKSAADRVGGEFVRSRVAARYNSATGRLLDAWLRLLTGGATGDQRVVDAFGLTPGRGVDATFGIGVRPLVSPRLCGAALRSSA
ncbi:MAG TPA: SIR2 family protein [Motilibacteraceae bacterium]|nr:SIR2 family protein [Motilibacteraceae bacterium]